MTRLLFVGPAKPQTSAKKKLRRRTAQYGKPYASVWWEFLNDPLTRVPGHYKAKLFRLRFRVPRTMFDYILQMFKEEPGWCPTIATDVDDDYGRSTHPIELKILAALRVLGRGECLGTCSEMCDIGENTLRVFFHHFCNKLGGLFDLVCHPPESEVR